MSNTIYVNPRDETHVAVRGPAGALMELCDRLTFEVPGHQFTPLFKSGIWDGKIRLFQPLRPLLYKGLLFELSRFCRVGGYELVIDPDVLPRGVSEWNGRESDLKQWVSESTSEAFEDRDYQVNAFVQGVLRERAIFLASTSSGKTLMIYRLSRFYVEKTGKPALIITTRKNLVDQMADDFVDYAPDEISVHKIKAGAEKENFRADYVVSTWQSAMNMDHDWFDRFSVVCADEAHNWDSKKLSNIMEKCRNVKYRFGFSGTLKESKVSELVLVGLFGPTLSVSKTKDRIAAGDVVPVKIKCIAMKWPEEVCKRVARGRIDRRGNPAPLTYQEEVNTIIAYETRMNAIVDYVAKLKGNVLVLFHRNDDYGKPLYDKMTARLGADRTMLVYGETEDEERALVKKKMSERDDVVAMASLGTFSEGMSINAIKHVVLSYPVKGRVRLLQSIGRGLRKEEGKVACYFHDFADDIRYKKRENYVWRHFINRLEIYEEEGFEYEVAEIDL